ncbi:Mpv17 / PMP22 family protein [Planoprotostelium fungivorum]|uniref:Mpv17 / PMP22 family protein n=1 Tax=Planoprotostelium fungivorum TaxID=1890364 RepID=A0A2P6NLU2_9EUKA|nr:Mpv17 / PMP22 family protein [Planoprotostelium fungivorum]
MKLRPFPGVRSLNKHLQKLHGQIARSYVSSPSNSTGPHSGYWKTIDLGNENDDEACCTVHCLKFVDGKFAFVVRQLTSEENQISPGLFIIMSLSKPIYAWKFYIHLLKTVPIQTKTGTAIVLGFLGNIVTQKVFEKKATFEWGRAGKVLAYYAIMMPIAHYWYKFLDRLFEKRAERAKLDAEKEKEKKPQTGLSVIDSTVLKKLALDELIFDPFCIFLFFTVIGVLERKSLSQIREKIGKEYWITQKMSWKLWPAVQLINFALVPGDFRILFVNVISFVWGIFLQLRASN